MAGRLPGFEIKKSNENGSSKKAMFALEIKSDIDKQPSTPQSNDDIFPELRNKPMPSKKKSKKKKTFKKKIRRCCRRTKRRRYIILIYYYIYIIY